MKNNTAMAQYECDEHPKKIKAPSKEKRTKEALLTFFTMTADCPQIATCCC